jgi:diacylglycerol O-acyltransferase
VFSQRLDRSKPLWELWLVERRSGDGWALLSKTHHAVVDGVSGVDLASVLFDLSPEGTPSDGAEPWVPQPEPSGAELAARGITGAVRAVTEVATGALGAVSKPGEALDRAREVAAGIGEVAWTALNAPPDTPFNVPPGSHRRLEIVRAGLDELKQVKTAFGTTVNDVVLAVVTGALAYFLQSRGRRTEGIELKAAVPVSVRSDDQRGALGNQLTQIMAPLPVFLDDPIARLQYVKDAMDGLKESRQALAASAIASLQDFAPPTIHAQASRLNFSGRFFNLLVTNVPGPQFPLYVLGRRMSEIFPIPFLAGERALAIAIISYDGKVGFGLLGDYDALPDLDVVSEGIEASLAQWVTLAQAS